ncbi:MAG: NUDIX domain-containing protein [Clostridia bacterium]|nr:NUDIX domain-containing protein [Clostridia bacterium]
MVGKLRNMATVYLKKDEKFLLLFRKGGKIVDRVWTGSAGGHFEGAEVNDAAACVLREMKEELGLSPEAIENLALRYVTLRDTKGEIRLNYYFFADLKAEIEDPVSNEGDCKWFSQDEISKLEMPITAKYVLDHYISAGRQTNELYVGVTNAKEVSFQPLPPT